jgi:acetyl-CoA carboxylase biotin carboxyl carrier protein
MAKNSTSKARKGLDRELIRELAELLDETGLTEIEIEQPDLRIRVARNYTQGIAAPAVVGAAPVAQAAPAAAGAKPAEDAVHPGAVPSPMVGTVYLSPEPGAAPFIKVGEQVTEGQTLMIVEAMKTMNHIAAPRSGKVTSILIEDQQPVEFGELLLILE